MSQEFRCFSCNKIKPQSSLALTRNGRTYCAPCEESKAKAMETVKAVRARLKAGA